jgi:peptidoglycan/xylan/chitin deacetylase (PgdA/CDA1 family)
MPAPWTDSSGYEQERRSRLLEALPAEPIGTALELACAEGRFTDRLAPRVRRLVAGDACTDALARASQRCARHGNVEFRRLDAATDALPQGLDLIVCSDVLYTVTDEARLRAVAARLAASLRPGGHLLAAHALVLRDDPSRTGFDWEGRWGAAAIGRVLGQTPSLAADRSIVTELYRIDRFVRLADGAVAARRKPREDTRPVTAPIDHELARQIVWGGAEARRSDVAARERRARIPVLAYHRIADDGPNALARYRVAPAAFEAQLRWLRRHGYHAVVSDDLGRFLRERHPFVGRPVMITFDDGYQDFADTAWPLLRRHDFRAEVFVVTDHAGGHAEWDRKYGSPAPLMNATTIVALAREGVRFGSHLATHQPADGLSTHELAQELRRSHDALVQWTGEPPCALAAPFGVVDERLQRLAVECGFRVAFSTRDAATALTDDPLRCPRIEVRGDMSLRQFAQRLEACR